MTKSISQRINPRQLLTGSGLRLFATVLSAVIGFFMTPFLVRELGDKLYGIWILVTSFSGVYGLLDLGLSGAVTRFVAMYLGKGDKNAVEKCINTSLIAYCCMGFIVILVSAGVTLFASNFIEAPKDISLVKFLIIIVGTEFAISFPMRALTGALSGKMRFDLVAGIQICFKLVSTFLIITIVINGGKLIPMALVGLSLAGIRGGIWFITTKRILPEVEYSYGKSSRQMFKKLFSFGIFSFIAQLADLIKFNIDIYVIAAFLGPSSVTHYSVSVALITYFRSVIISMNVLGPVLAQQFGAGDMVAMRKTLSFGLRMLTSIAVFMGFGLIAWGQPFIELWMGKEYLDAYECLIVLTIGMVIASSQNSGQNLVYASGKFHLYAILNSVEALANVVCSLIFVRYWGILGVALGTAVPMFLSRVVIQPWLVSSVSGMPFFKYWGIFGKALLFAFIALVIPYYITQNFVIVNYRVLVLVGSLCLLTYSSVIIILNFSQDERVFVTNKIKNKFMRR